MEGELNKVAIDYIDTAISQIVGKELKVWALINLGSVVVVASIAAYFGAYLRKRAELRAVASDFENALNQLKAQTGATETIRTRLASELERLKSSNERERSFVSYQRDRLSSHLDSLYLCAAEIFAISDVVRRRTWTESNSYAETQQRMLTHISTMRLHAIVLREFSAIDKQASDIILSKLGLVRNAWDNLIGELAKKDPTFSQQFPAAPAYDGAKYFELGGQLYSEATELVDIVGNIPKNIRLPV
jgi:hypothetical protein